MIYVDKERKLVELARAFHDKTSVGKLAKEIAHRYIGTENSPHYFNQLFRLVGDGYSKTTLSKAVHLLCDEYGILERYPDQTTVSSSEERKILVTMFKVRDEYFDILREYDRLLLNI